MQLMYVMSGEINVIQNPRDNIKLIQYHFIIRKDIRYYFTVLQSDERFALACPGGFIFITEGMINDLNNEAELAGILAHEIAHINQKHVVDQVIPAADQSSALIHRLLTAKHTTTTVTLMVYQQKPVTFINKALIKVMNTMLIWPLFFI